MEKKKVLKKHPRTIIELYHGTHEIYPEKGKMEWNANTGVRSELASYLRNNSFPSCPNCGGLLPELVITDKEKTYAFTCTTIAENDKFIRQTDYTKLLSFLLARYLAQKHTLTKEGLDRPLRDYVREICKEIDGKEPKKESE